MDHPRVGGEKSVCTSLFMGWMGSPPRGRGKVPSICKNMERVGITPAWAGKSWPWQRAAWRTRDHPRVGGEKNTKQKSGDKDTGSPPRGRGKGLDALEVAGFIGITPAWAGKRAIRLSRWIRIQDHPRVGGEKPPALGISATDTGSPPRGRGKALRGIPRRGCAGITPAWAGKRLFPRYVFHGEWDHPRVGGEKPFLASCRRRS